jgi:hypothetical protein
MSTTDREISAVEERNLHAYHDDELGAVARWWWRRRIARSPRLHEHLEQLAEIGNWVREADSGQAPDVWDQIALRLPAVDAVRADTPDAASGLDRWTGFRPIMAAAATAAVAVAVALGTIGGDPGQRAGAVRWLDTGGRGVIVLDNPEAATIVWLLDPPGDGV